MADNIINDEGAMLISNCVKTHPFLHFLDLSKCDLTAESILVISEDLIGKLHDIHEKEDGEIEIKGVSNRLNKFLKFY